MSVGYLTGGLVHHLFPDRSSAKSCASQFFYPIFCVSYLSMTVSMWAWLYTIKEQRSISVIVIRGTILISAIAIAVGATWCQLTVHLIPFGKYLFSI